MPEPKEIAVTVADGKYTVVFAESGGVRALRYGEKWRDCAGDNLIASLARELADARDIISTATNCLVCFPIADATEVFQNTLAILTASTDAR